MEEDDENTIYFAVGGLFFLRFVVPSIFAPHVYGLMENPPCQAAQRQLVLISKVLQSVANLVLPGNKEEFMGQLAAFVNKQIPKVKEFYNNLLNSVDGPTHTNYEVPVDIIISSRINIYTSVFYNQNKIKEEIPKLTQLPEAYLSQIENIVHTYGEPPKKLKEKKKKE